MRTRYINPRYIGQDAEVLAARLRPGVEGNVIVYAVRAHGVDVLEVHHDRGWTIVDTRNGQCTPFLHGNRGGIYWYRASMAASAYAAQLAHAAAADRLAEKVGRV